MHYSDLTEPVPFQRQSQDICMLCFLGLKDNKYWVSTRISNIKNVNKYIFVHVDFYVAKCNSIVVSTFLCI